MRRSGSASCILRPKHSLSAEDLQRLAAEAPTTTVLTVDRLPPYCTDRLYLLSELQVHAHSVRFLCDLDDGTAPPAAPAFPPSVILYLPWRPNTYPTPRSFADGPLSECVRRCLLANGDEVPPGELEEARSSPRQSPYSPRRQSQSLSPRRQSDPLPPNARALSDPPPLPLGSFSRVGEMDDPNAKKIGGEVGSESPGPKRTYDSPREARRRGQDEPKPQLTSIYVVVDRISSSEDDDSLHEFPDFPALASSRSFDELEPSSETQQPKPPPTHEEEEARRRDRHNDEVETAKQLTRAVASSKFLRTRIDGISVGITSDARAAPGLEACMDAVERGAKERRGAARDALKNEEENRTGGVSRRRQMLERLKETSPERSPVALVAMHPDDIEATADHHHDHSHHHGHSEHVEPILQCRISTEWSGKGEYRTFSDRAMRDWRRAWGDPFGGDGRDGRRFRESGRGVAVRPRVPRISRGRDDDEEEEPIADEPISTVMVVVFLAVAAKYVWGTYGGLVLSLLFGEAPEEG